MPHPESIPKASRRKSIITPIIFQIYEVVSVIKTELKITYKKFSF